MDNKVRSHGGQVYVFRKFEGKNIYTKLDQVIKVPTHFYEAEKLAYGNLGERLFNEKPVKAYHSKQNSHFTGSSFMTKYHEPHRKSVSKANKVVEINEDTKEGLFLDLFKKAIKRNIKKSDSCLSLIDNQIHVKRGISPYSSISKLPDIRSSLIPKPTDHHQTKSDQINTINSIRQTAIDPPKSLQAEDQKRRHLQEENKLLIIKQEKIRRFRNILINALTYLYMNNIHITDFMENNVIPGKPMGRLHSYIFFEMVKFNRKEEALALISKDKFLLLDIDYFGQTCFHWAAKRNYIQLLEELILRGNHLNLYDRKKRTPLFLSAQNNHKESSEILLKNGANPFLKDIDGKGPYDVVTDQTTKRIIDEYMDKYSHLNSKNFFRQKVLKFHKEEFLNVLKDETEKNLNIRNRMSKVVSIRDKSM